MQEICICIGIKMFTIYKMEIKGIISEGSTISFNCCDTIKDLKIDDISLYDFFEEIFNQDEQTYFYNTDTQSPKYNLRYIILDKPPKIGLPFEHLSAIVIFEMLYCEHNAGCYSEYTCGFGGFNYIINECGRSIFDELRSYEGKYLHLII